MSAKAKHERYEEQVHDRALEDTFPASDPVALKAPQREPAPASKKETSEGDSKLAKLRIPKPQLDDEALPPERPA